MARMVQFARGGFALVALALLAGPVAAQQTWQRDVRLSGMGVRKCSDWLGWKTAGNGEARAMTVEWMQGFFAGHNVYARTNEAQPSVFADARTLATLLDNYCQKRPDDRIIAGVLDITQGLGGAKVNIGPSKPAAPAAPGAPANPPEAAKPPRES